MAPGSTLPADVSQRVNEALRQLDSLAELQVSSHVDVYENVQQVLADTLTAVDEE